MGREITQLGYPSYRSESSRLESLFAEILKAIDSDELQVALRLADCACRVAPEDVTCLLIHARLLTRLGRAAEAEMRLRGRQEPDIVAARGIALCALGFTDEAVSSCEMLLHRCALDAVADLPQLASAVCHTADPAKFNSWVGIDSKLQLVGQVSSGSQPAFAVDGTKLPEAAIVHGDDGLDSFTLHVPVGVFGRISVSASGSNALGSSVRWPPDFRFSGWALVEGNALLGRVRIDWAPALPIVLAARQSGREPARFEVTPSSGDSWATQFSISLDALDADSSPLEVYALLPDGSDAPLAGSPVAIHASPPIAAPPRPASDPAEPRKGASSSRLIDIVIPIYAGADETLCCIRSVLATTARSDAQLVVVNDASPDRELCDALDRLAEDAQITLLTNPSNLGFPAAANRGIDLHPWRDVVLLNADTEVFGDWLERLRCAAYSAGHVGTVTPMGECASIVSYPGEDQHATTAPAAIDCIAREVNARKLVELPVGVGFCLFIKRTCLDETGPFDDRTFGKGYGEENDFCMRARVRGWRHLAATDVFVRHRGGRSFGPMKAALMERNSRVLNLRYPGYEAMVADFVAADPLLEARRAIDMELLLLTAQRPVLQVTGNLTGGVKRHGDERHAELINEGRTAIVLQPSENPKNSDQVRLTVSHQRLENLVFSVPRDLSILRAFLLKLGLERIELHHLFGFPQAVLELVCGLGVDYEVYVHDYVWICPRISLVKEDGTYCGEPGIDGCDACIRAHGVLLKEPATVKALREQSAGIMAGARKVIVPSHDVRARLARYFPNFTADLIPWEPPPHRAKIERATIAGRVRVALIGAISYPKGYQALLDCARDAATRDLDLEFVVVGFTCGDQALLETGRVFVTGPYADREVSELLAREQCHVALFPSVVPETWCYALTHALAKGLPVVAFNLGAMAERLRDYDAADLLPLSSTASQTNDALLRAVRRASILGYRKETDMDPVSTSTPSPTDGPTTSIQFLNLPAGVYTLTVKEGAPLTTPQDELSLPAMLVGVAPAQSEGSVEFLSRATTTDRWLSRRRDMILAKISGGSASLMLTSLRSPDCPVLGIDIRRLDPDQSPFDSYPKSENPASDETQGVLPAQILAHIHRLGDVPFKDGWAGCLGDRLWIEAFAIGSVGPLTADSIEYCGVAADGLQTPWLSNAMLCGSRGRGMPMMGCAFRLKPDLAERYDCSYSGQFVSGKTLGPFRNGDLCCSDQPLDPLWGIEIYAIEREASSSYEPSDETQNTSVVA